MKYLIAALLIVVGITPITVKAAPVAGATKTLAEKQKEANLRAPIAGWQQKILDQLNEKPKKKKTKRYKLAGPDTLNRTCGVYYGPSGKESYYNLPMERVVAYMRDLGYNDRYWIRQDGAKMLGDYVMVAADLSIRPKGTILQTSLGPAIVCDTGTFIEQDNKALDIAVNWR